MSGFQTSQQYTHAKYAISSMGIAYVRLYF